MKKINLLFVLVLTLLVASCSSDDDDNSSDTSGDILGTWNGVDVEYTGDTTTEGQGQTLVADFVGDAYDVDYTMTFTENPNELTAIGSYSIELTTTVAGQTQVQNVENLEFIGDSTWSISGNELTATSNGETDVLDILELTDTTLKLGLTTTEDLSQQGFIITSNIDVVMTYTRQ